MSNPFEQNQNSDNENNNMEEKDEGDKNTLQYKIIGQFLLELYHKNQFDFGNGVVKKQLIFNEFRNYCENRNLKNLPEFEKQIGTLLRENGFLLNTERGSGLFKIRLFGFRKFYTDYLKDLDDLQIKSAEFKVFPKITSSEMEEKKEIEVNNDETCVEFQKGTNIQKKDIFLTNRSCFICQENFSSEEDYEDHIEYHGEASGFKSISDYTKSTNSDIELSYSTCKGTYLLRFAIKTNLKNLIIEKIVIVRSRWMDYPRNEDVPFEMPSNGIDYFYVDCHLFNIAVPQPIVIIYRCDNNYSLNVSQYLFMRFEDFPFINMKLRSNRVICRDEMKLKTNLPFYFPEGKFLQLCKFDCFSNDDLGMADEQIREYLRENKELKPSNMCRVLEILLKIEDIKTDSKYKKLTQKNVDIQGYCGEYSLTLKNIDRDLINILKPYDDVVLIPLDKENNRRRSNYDTEYGANDDNKKQKKIRFTVYRVYNNKICFTPRKNGIRNISLDIKYDVQFSSCRLPIMYQYRALEILRNKPLIRHYLYPTVNSNKNCSLLRLEYYNNSVKSNPEQMQAVMNITDGPNKCAPYLIFGPPGTGKTTTVVESVYQLWKKDKKFNKILVTAGSNAACDEVAKRLCEIFNDVDPNGLNLLRIYAASIEKRIDNIDENLLEASNLCYNYHFYPSIENIKMYCVVIATLTVVGKLVHGSIEEGHFTHVFIDECAASTEPEALVGIAGILSPNSSLILSGDINQLGPILESPRAADLGLNISLMERLLKRKCYETDIATRQYDKTIQTRLVRNFRSNRNILCLSNVLYYHNELLYCASKDVTDCAIGWSELPNKNFPIIFNVTYGHTERRGTSRYNYKELDVTMDYVFRLMYFGLKGKKIEQSDIGIISPYKEQCNLIREYLDKRQWYKIEVGSVEIFQGKEKPIIIISMVRSDKVGFLDNPKRLNVTLSRAQALMIIIGNPETLSEVRDWKYVIDYCNDNKALTGAKYPRQDRRFAKRVTNQLVLGCRTNSLTSIVSDTVSNVSNKDKNIQINRRNNRNNNSNNRNNNNSNNNDGNNNENNDSTNNKMNRRRRRYGRGFQRHDNNKTKQNSDIPDNESITSSKVDAWLQEFSKDREQIYKTMNYNYEDDASSIHSYSVEDNSVNSFKMNSKNDYSPIAQIRHQRIDDALRSLKLTEETKQDTPRKSPKAQIRMNYNYEDDASSMHSHSVEYNSVNSFQVISQNDYNPTAQTRHQRIDALRSLKLTEETKQDTPQKKFPMAHIRQQKVDTLLNNLELTEERKTNISQPIQRVQPMRQEPTISYPSLAEVAPIASGSRNYTPRNTRDFPEPSAPPLPSKRTVFADSEKASRPLFYKELSSNKSKLFGKDIEEQSKKSCSIS